MPLVDRDVERRTTRLSVVIVTYNSAGTIDECLASLLSSSPHGTEVIVVDNDSSDDTVDRLGRHDVTVVASSENLGYARACNVGARRATGDYLLMLNPDTVATPGAIETALRRLERDSSIGIAGATTTYSDGSINSTCCFAQPTLWSTFTRAVGLSTVFSDSAVFNPEEYGAWDRRTTRDVGAITGCFLMIERSLFLRVGGYDERFFMYSEDTDLSIQVSRTGRRCVHLHDVVVVHHGGRSEPDPAMKMVKVLRARAQLFRKHWSKSNALIGIALLDLTVLARALGHQARPPSKRSANSSKWPEVWRHRTTWHRV